LPGTRTAKAEKPTPKDLEAAWADLANTDAAKGYRAMGKLLAHPDAAVALLKEQLPPVTATVDAAVLKWLLEDLASDKYAVRTKAETELKKLGELAEPALQKGLEN